MLKRQIAVSAALAFTVLAPTPLSAQSRLVPTLVDSEGLATLEWTGSLTYSNDESFTTQGHNGTKTMSSSVQMDLSLEGPMYTGKSVDGRPSGAVMFRATGTATVSARRSEESSPSPCDDGGTSQENTETKFEGAAAVQDPHYYADLYLIQTSNGELEYTLKRSAFPPKSVYTEDTQVTIRACGGEVSTLTGTHTDEYWPEAGFFAGAADEMWSSWSGRISASSPRIGITSAWPNHGGGTTRVTIELTGTPPCQPSTSTACVLAADAGGPYQITRATPFSLRAGNSRGPVAIAKYRWTFTPVGGCPPGVHLSNPVLTTTNPQVEIVALCDLNASLQVTDAVGATAHDSTTITVGRRTTRSFAPTKVDLVNPGSARDPRTPRGPITSEVGVVLGANVSRCRPDDLAPPLCPRIDRPLDGNAYRTKQVHDPQGPFDGFHYVRVNRVRVPQVALYNVHLFKGSTLTFPHPRNQEGKRITWLAFNQRAYSPVGALREALRQHEGWGKGGSAARPRRTGHAGATQLALRKDATINDPAIVLERTFARSRTDMVDSANTDLKRIDRMLTRAARDPLPAIYRGKFWFWNPEAFEWERCTIQIGNTRLIC